MAGRANAISDIERAEHINTGDGIGVKRAAIYIEDSNGNIRNVTESDLAMGGIPANKATDAYDYQALSQTSTYMYVFNEDGNGNWYIQRFLLSTMKSDYTKGTGGYLSVYVNSTSAPSGTLTWGTYDQTFDNVGAESLSFDSLGNLKVNIQSPLETNGAIPVNIQDQHSQIINSYAVKVSGSVMTLASNITLGSYTAVMTAGHTFVNGDTFYIAQDDKSFMATVLNVATNTLTLDTPFDYAFPSASSVVFEVSKHMNVDGSSTTQIFEIATGAASTISLDIYSLRLHIMDNTAMDESTFGGISALTRGLVCRKVSANGSQYFYWNAKTNGELSIMIDNTEYSTKAPSGQYAVMFQWKIRETHGVSIRIEPGDKLELLVQDDLTSLTSMECTVQGHVVTN